MKSNKEVDEGVWLRKGLNLRRLIGDNGYMKPYPTATKREAYRLYALGEQKQYIIVQTGITPAVLEQWIHKGRWLEKKRKLTEEAEAIVEQQISDVILSSKLQVVLDDLDMSAHLHQAIKKSLLDSNGQVRKLKPRDIELLAKAAKNSSDIATRQVGISGEKGVGGNHTTVNIATMGEMKTAVGVSED